MDRLDPGYLTNLVVRAKRGNSNAFAELFSATSPLLYAYLETMLPDKNDAQQALTDCTVLIRQSLQGFVQPELYMPWALRICYRHCAGEAEGTVPTPEGNYALSQVIQLPLAESQVLLMHYGQGFSLANAGTLLNFSTRLTRRHLKEGLRRLRRGAPAGAGAPVSPCGAGWSELRASKPDALRQAAVLEEVFQRCGQDGNTVPLEALASYAVYRKERFSLQRGVLAALLVLFFLLPGMFLLPKLELDVNGTGLRGLPVYTVRVQASLPVRRVTARIRNRSLPVYEDAAKRFSVEPTRNGELTVTVELVNRQRAAISRKVTEVDAESPKLDESKVTDQTVRLTVHDTGIGVDYSGVYALAGDGTVIRPLSSDPDKNQILFPYPDENWDVYIPDYIGNTLHLALTLK